MKISEATREQLELALRESVKLQAHYAKLLNVHDRGERMIFEDVDAWLTRLQETISPIDAEPNVDEEYDAADESDFLDDEARERSK